MGKDHMAASCECKLYHDMLPMVFNGMSSRARVGQFLLIKDQFCSLVMSWLKCNWLATGHIVCFSHRNILVRAHGTITVAVHKMSSWSRPMKMEESVSVCEAVCSLMLNNPTQYCPTKQKGSNCLELRKMAFIYLGLAVTANMTPISSNTQYNGGRITCLHD
jgi:hypothetical protein